MRTITEDSRISAQMVSQMRVSFMRIISISRKKDVCFYMIMHAKLQPYNFKGLLSQPGEILLRVMVKIDTKSYLCGEMSVVEDSYGEGKLDSFKWLFGTSYFANCWQKHPGVIKNQEISLAVQIYQIKT